MDFPKTAGFRTRLLYSPVYRRAHGIDRVIAAVTAGYQDPLVKKHIAVFMLRYVEDDKGCRLGLMALIHSDSNLPGSCIQGDMATGANCALEVCRKVGLDLLSVVPVSYTTSLSGIHIGPSGATNLDRA
jgi:hypothetical protein